MAWGMGLLGLIGRLSNNERTKHNGDDHDGAP
jgi:hypothetical protein